MIEGIIVIVVTSTNKSKRKQTKHIFYVEHKFFACTIPVHTFSSFLLSNRKKQRHQTIKNLRMMFLTAAAAAATRRCAVGQFPASVASVLASSGRGLPLLRIGEKRQTMGTIADGVDFDVIAREWRCKWSEDNDKKSLKEAQEKLTKVLSDLKGIDGCKSVHRVVCGGNLDFKVASI